MSLKIEVRTGNMRGKTPQEWIFNNLKRRIIGLKQFLFEAGLKDERTLIFSCIRKEEPRNYKLCEIIIDGYNGGVLKLKFQASGQETIYSFHCFWDMPGSDGKKLYDIFNIALTREKDLIRKDVLKGFLMGDLESSSIRTVNPNTIPVKNTAGKDENGSPPTLSEIKQKEPEKQVLTKSSEGQSQAPSGVMREDLRGFANNPKEVDNFLKKLSERAKFGVVSVEVLKEELLKLAKKVTNQTVGQVVRRLIEYNKLFKCKEGYTTDVSKAEPQSLNQKAGTQSLVLSGKVVEPEVLPKKDSSGLAKVLETTSLLDFTSLLKTLSEVYLQGMKEIEVYEQTVASEGEEVARLEATLSERRSVLNEKKNKLEELRVVVSPEGKHFKANQQIEALKRLVATP